MSTNHGTTAQYVDGNAALASVPEDEEMVLEPPSVAATLTISKTPESLEVQTSVPGRWTGYMMQTLMCLVATAASTAGPVLVLKMTSVIVIPWEVTLGLAALTALMPLTYVILSNRRPNV
ncbi:hypothetical protein [Streptomyces sp. NPDC047009]|uniref:hypothetical protein n=1 Tax=Streptomyces sp. NPDC047009 TaxID=3154496 RepID=UPI00340C1A99